jgi:hypothetical protein
LIRCFYNILFNDIDFQVQVHFQRSSKIPL